MIQGVEDEAEPRPPPPPPSPQHRLHRHPHRRPPGDESIVFGPLSECEEPCAERARVQQIGGQTRTSGRSVVETALFDDSNFVDSLMPINRHCSDTELHLRITDATDFGRNSSWMVDMYF